MLKAIKVSVLASALAVVSACGNSEKQVEPKTDIEKQSYAVGASMGRYLNDNMSKHAELGLQLNEAMIVGGIKDALAEKIQLTDDEIEQLMTSLEKEVRTLRTAHQEKVSKEAKEAGANFLTENAKRPEVTVTDSGLQYEVLTQAEGEKPSATDRVTVHYHGTLVDGSVFDSSVERGSPSTFGLNQVISGWTEGVQLMSVGSKYKFYIPSELGYGGRSAGKIAPHSTLIFEVELLAIEK